MTRAVVAIPWRSSPGREPAYRLVRRWLEAELPAAPILEIDTPHEPYNLAAVRNACVRAAESLGAEVVVIPDADTIIGPPGTLATVVEHAGIEPRGSLHLPFTRLRYIEPDETDRLIEGGEPDWRATLRGNGGCYVARPSVWWAIGGQDERFSGWGGEDDQIIACAMTLAVCLRHPGVGLSLWHPACRDIGSDRHRPNGELAHRYWRSIGDPDRMRAIIAER